MDNFRINGGRGFTNEFLLDGVPNTGTETTQPNNLSFVPSPDATAEFKVQTSIYDAQYGRTGGGSSTWCSRAAPTSSTATSTSTTATRS
jgi:hypothetical protein